LGDIPIVSIRQRATRIVLALSPKRRRPEPTSSRTCFVAMSGRIDAAAAGRLEPAAVDGALEVVDRTTASISQKRDGSWRS
jgi:hypothetical protein